MKLIDIQMKFPYIYEKYKEDEEKMKLWLKNYNHKKKISTLKKRIKSKKKRKRIYRKLKNEICCNESLDYK